MKAGKLKGIIIKIVILAVVFAAAAAGVFAWMSRENISGDKNAGCNISAGVSDV